MRTYWRVLGFARPISKYAIPYFFYTLFYALFNTFNFVMIIPILNTLFNTAAVTGPVTQMPSFSGNGEFLNEAVNYFLYRVYGTDFTVMQVLGALAVIIVISSLLSNLFRYLGQRTVENMKINTLCRLRNEVFDNVMDLDPGFFSNECKGDIISKLTSDVQVVQFCISNTLQVAFREPFLILGYFTALIFISWELTIFAALFLPVAAGVIGTIVKRLRKKATRAQEVYGEMVSTLDESISGVKVIKAYNATEYIKDKFHGRNNLFSRISRSMARRQQLSSPMSEFLGITAAAVLLLYGGSLVTKGLLSGSEFIAYLGMFTQITRPVRAFADAFANINQGIAAGERVFGLLDATSAITEKPDAVDLDRFSDSIEFRDVKFSYENKEIIHGVSFSIRKGETVALVGPSGGGKTTLSDLIPRFYDVDSGQILVDGRDLRDFKVDSLHAKIGVVSQDTILFNDTIANNLLLGRRDATESEVREAARIANAHEFIMQMEYGYDTNIGDRGMKLSGGQRQRLSIARAILKNPEIQILDEATSALDTESEKLVQDALDNLLVGRTSVVIAHRLSTICNADKIIVIDKGNIVEQGTHAELIEKGGLYSKLVSMQHMA